MDTINHRLFAFGDGVDCVDNEDVDPVSGLPWCIYHRNPNKRFRVWYTGPKADQFLSTAEKLRLAGWPILDEPGVWPTMDDANGWIGSMRQIYKDLPTLWTGYQFPGTYWMFDYNNQIARLDTGEAHRNWTPTNPTYPYDRVRSEFVQPLLTDFPSPRDFNAVLESAVFRIVLRVKLCLTAARLCTFGKHGGRPAKAEK